MARGVSAFQRPSATVFGVSEAVTPAPTGLVESFRYAFSSAARLRREILAGLTVALALIPEAIAFSILAGVDPALGLFASVIMAITIAFTGGRPAMILSLIHI